MDLSPYYVNLAQQTEFELISNTKYEFIGQIILFNLSTNSRFYEYKIKELINNTANHFNWGVFNLKIHPPDRYKNTAIAILTLKDNYLHLDVIRRLDGYILDGLPIRIRPNGFTNMGFNLSLDISYYNQKDEVKVFNNYNCDFKRKSFDKNEIDSITSRYISLNPKLKSMSLEVNPCKKRCIEGIQIVINNQNKDRKVSNATSKNDDDSESLIVDEKINYGLDSKVLDSIIKLIDQLNKDNKSIQTDITSINMDSMLREFFEWKMQKRD